MTRLALALFRASLRFYPGEFRNEYGREMTLLLSNRYAAAASLWERILISLETLTGLIAHAPAEHLAITFRDLRHAVRLLSRSPAFAMTAILSLALGVGANTAIFAVAKKVLFDTLPVKDSRQLRILTWVSGPERPVPPVWGDVGSTAAGGLTSTAFSYPVLEEFRKTSVFQDLIAFKDIEMTATVDAHPELVAAEMLSGNAFSALGVPTILGRDLTPADDAVAVISEIYWTQSFGRSVAVLGKTISLNGIPVTVIGVAAAPFTGLTLGHASEVFVPLTMQPVLIPRAQKFAAGNLSLLKNPQSWWVAIMARQRTDVSEARAQATLDTVLRQTAKATLPGAKGLDQLHLQLQPGDRGIDGLAGFAKPAYVLVALAVMVLLLACLNLANLLLANATVRQREFSTRLALGAGRAIIFRQLITESLLLSALGGLAGFVLAYAGRSVIPALLAASRRSHLVTDFDGRVLLFTLGVSLLTGLLFGAMPMWQVFNSTLGRLKTKPRAWTGKGLVIAQVALSTILLLAAGLFVRTLDNLSRLPVGFQPGHLLLFKINPPRSRYTDRQLTALYGELEGRLAKIGGVRSVTTSQIALIGDGHSGSTFRPSGSRVPTPEERVQTILVGADFFATMAIPILQGRPFTSHDNAAAPKVAVINRALARRYFPSENPIGRTFECEDVAGPVEIVGVAADTRYADLRTATPPTYFTPYQQGDPPARMIFEIRTFAEPFTVIAPVRAAVESLDRDLPLIDVRSQQQQILATLASERLFAELTSGFGVVALVLATVGIYGLMAYTVARRTGEIGIRIALGARMEQVIAGVLREALWLVLAGLLAGVTLSLLLARFIGAMLYGLKPTDPATIAFTAALLIAVALLGGLGPARRAGHVNPLSALRHQ